MLLHPLEGFKGGGNSSHTEQGNRYGARAVVKALGVDRAPRTATAAGWCWQSHCCRATIGHPQHALRCAGTSCRALEGSGDTDQA